MDLNLPVVFTTGSFKWFFYCSLFVRHYGPLLRRFSHYIWFALLFSSLFLRKSVVKRIAFHLLSIYCKHSSWPFSSCCHWQVVIVALLGQFHWFDCGTSGQFHWFDCGTSWAVSLIWLWYFLDSFIGLIVALLGCFIDLIVALLGHFHWFDCGTSGLFHWFDCGTSWAVSLIWLWHILGCFNDLNVVLLWQFHWMWHFLGSFIDFIVAHLGQFHWFDCGTSWAVSLIWLWLFLGSFIDLIVALLGQFHGFDCGTSWAVSLIWSWHYLGSFIDLIVALLGQFHWFDCGTSWAVPLMALLGQFHWWHFLDSFIDLIVAILGQFHWLDCGTFWAASFNCLCWGLMFQSTIFQSCRDGATTSWVINQYFQGVKCLAQGHNMAAVGFEPPTSRSGSFNCGTCWAASLIWLWHFMDMLSNIL